MSFDSERSLKRWRPSGDCVPAALFFLAVFLYVRNGIDPRLMHHWQGPVFYTYPGFAGEFFRCPGGFAEYLYGLIAQCYAWRDWGALVLTAEIAAACALGALLVRRQHGKTRLLLALTPALFLLYQANLYYDGTPVRIALVIGLGCAVAFGRLMPFANRPAVWCGLFALFLAFSYYLGGMALVFFAPVAACALWVRAAPNWSKAARFLLCGSVLAAAAGLPLAVETYRLLDVRWPAASWFLSSDVRRIVVFWGLYLWTAALAGLSLRRVATVSAGAAASGGAGSAGRAGATAAKRAQSSQALSAAAPGAAWKRLGRYAPTALLFGALAGVMGYSYQAAGRDRRLAALDYFTWSENWDAAVRTAEALKPGEFNTLSRYQVNLALHEMGRMGDEMFRFPQDGGPLLELQVNSFLPYMLHLTNMCLRLGRVNEAEHYGSEALVFSKTDPRVYRLLALTYLVKGQTEAARKFLTVLSYSPLDRRWADGKLQSLQQDPQLTGDEQVQELRRRRLQTDDMLAVWQQANHSGPDVERLLLNLLERDSSNRMAFEFLMGYYLLNRDLQGFRNLATRIAEITGPGYLRPGGGRRTPRHYQEALVLFNEMTGSSGKISGMGIEPETVSRMARFKQVVARAGGRRAAMLEAREGFGDTYFYYYAFGSEDVQ